TRKQWRRFRSIKRGYWSLLAIVALLAISVFAEVLVNGRALVVHYEGHWYFPTYGAFLPGKTFGLDYEYETNYRQLKNVFATAHAGGQGPGNWPVLPPGPYNAYGKDFRTDAFPPYPPSLSDKHFLGTDVTGRDILARLVYGFRLAMAFAVILLV